MIKLWSQAAVLVFALLLTSCGSDNFLYDNSFEDACWAIDDTLDFAVEKEAEVQLQLYVELASDYEYQNLYLKAFVQGPGGAERELLLNDTLFSAGGEWLIPAQGSAQQVAYASPFSLEGPAGMYRLRLIQFMREEKLCGIRSLGVSRLE